MCYERGWEAQQRNEEATGQIRRLFARYRAEARRARDPEPEPPFVAERPAPVAEREDESKLVLR